MTSMDQLSAYLETSTPQEERAIIEVDKGIPWKNTLLSEISAYLEHGKRPGAWQTTGNLDSEVRGVRSDQQNWQRAVELAGRAGVDMQLLTESAENMRHMQEVGQNVGHVATLQLLPDYRALFE